MFLAKHCETNLNSFYLAKQHGTPPGLVVVSLVDCLGALVRHDASWGRSDEFTGSTAGPVRGEPDLIEPGSYEPASLIKRHEPSSSIIKPSATI